MYRNFNSHAHVERDYCGMFIRHTPCISTHTLTWSVTRDRLGTWGRQVYFNSHAHVERDLVGKFGGEIQLNFNSHAHVERDAINTSPL